jgi:hypothetical protein
MQPDLPDGQDQAATSETPTFTGRVVAALYEDPDVILRTGDVVIGAEAALRYGFGDVNGKQPPSRREQLGSLRGYGPGH